jgi:hypothetical protein
MPRPRKQELSVEQAEMRLRLASSAAAEYHVGSLNSVAESGGKATGRMRQAVQFLLDNDLVPSSYQIAEIFGIAINSARNARCTARRMAQAGRTADEV